MRVEHYRRTENGWEIEVLTTPDDPLAFEAVGFESDLAAVYEGVTFREAARAADRSA
jgi:hypothetical protein